MGTVKGMEILNNAAIAKKITRIALQIYEENATGDAVVIAGLSGNGWHLAQKIAEALEQLSPLKVECLEVTVNKLEPSEKTTRIQGDISKATGKYVVVVDDVLNTGRTLVYGLSPFISARAAIIRTAVLADRNHHKFPVDADFVGISMATTLQEHIELRVGENGAMSLHLN